MECVRVGLAGLLIVQRSGKMQDMGRWRFRFEHLMSGPRNGPDDGCGQAGRV